jgi:hypothetical protein
VIPSLVAAQMMRMEKMMGSSESDKDKDGKKSNSGTKPSNTEQETSSKVQRVTERGRTFGAPGAEKRG